MSQLLMTEDYWAKLEGIWKVPVVIRPEFIGYLERANDRVYVHCDVFKWNRTVKEEVEFYLQILIKLQDGPLYAEHEVGDKKHLKWLKMYKFEFLESRIDSEGQVKQVYIRKDQ